MIFISGLRGCVYGSQAGLLSETTRLARSRFVVNFIVKMTVCLYGQVGWPACEISLNRMKISPYKHLQAGWPGCRDESSTMPPQAIFIVDFT